MLIAGMSKVDHHFQIAMETVERVFNRRSGIADMCAQIKAFDYDTIAPTLPPDMPTECVKPVFDFYKNTMCSDVCINSPLLADMASRRAGSRQLLGGAPDDPISACDDPCFSPFMTGMIGVMKATMTPTCQTAFESDPPPGRRLMGGDQLTEDNMADMEIGFGLLCSKNAAGSYCMTLLQALEKDNSTGIKSTATATVCHIYSGGLVG